MLLRKGISKATRFDFVSFKDVRDRQVLVKRMGGIKMGDFKLKINVARYAVENSSGVVQTESEDQIVRDAGQAYRGRTYNLRDARSYCDVVGTSKAGGSAKAQTDRKEEDKWVKEISIVVQDRTWAFKNFFGSALVGRTADLETLVDFDRLLRIAKIDVTNIQYLGGLSLFISFHGKALVNQFLENKILWEPWFTKLDLWSGQSLPHERFAWLKISGIPLHLFDMEVLAQVGECFGKILHVPKYIEEEQDLLVCRVGILAGEANRIKEEVSLKWKNRTFRKRKRECRWGFKSQGWWE
ncbi:hypothetical protein HanPI659440_Chr09g0341801 [Helianthus annuus]|nr:hypothetical protein HanPI659440_Chr09g0341801 [Helianthus annuus]